MKEHEWIASVLINIAAYTEKYNLIQTHSELCDMLGLVTSELTAAQPLFDELVLRPAPEQQLSHHLFQDVG